MKAVKNITRTAQFFLIVAATSLQVVHAQDSTKITKAAAIQNMVDSKNYVFIAQSVLPLGRHTRQLTSYYDLKVSKDTVVSELPYFGRAYTAPINPAEGGIHFTSTNFEYTTTVRKKGGWDILIKPKDVSEVRQLTLSISEKGYSSLQVISNNRQPISFTGYIREMDIANR